MKIFLALALCCSLLASAHAAGRNWTLTQVNGGEFSIAEDSGGKPSLLVFWATWCTPCKAELSALKGTYDSLATRGVNVILISEDTQKSQSKVKPFLDAKGFTWIALHDPDAQVLKTYGGSKIPYTVLLNANGTPVLEYLGEMKDTTELLAKVNELLGAASE